MLIASPTSFLPFSSSPSGFASVPRGGMPGSPLLGGQGLDLGFQERLTMMRILDLMQGMLSLMGGMLGLGGGGMASTMAMPGGQPAVSQGLPGVTGGGGGASAGGLGAASSPSSTAAPVSGGPVQGTSTGQRLAEIARAEATNGDSKGGLCFRDVGRSLRKIGIETSGASAYMAADQLARNPKVKEIKVPQSQLARLPAGAIVVWDRGAGKPHGHISISTGDGKEASDLMRNQITNYGTSFRVFMPQ